MDLLPYAIRRALREREMNKGASALYWRDAYEKLVQQTGRDLNDGLGRDPRTLAASNIKARS